MLFRILIRLFLVLIFCLIVNIRAWGYDYVLSQDELHKNQHNVKKYFKNGFVPHSGRVGFRLKNSQHNEVELFALMSYNENKLSVIYQKNEHKVIVRVNVLVKNITTLWEAKYHDVNLEVENWHFMVYRFGKQFFKIWIDCELRRNINGYLKTSIDLDEDVIRSFGKLNSLRTGDNDDIEYNQPLKFLALPHLGSSFDDRSLCKNIFNLTYPQIRINDDYTSGTFYPLSFFEDNLTKYDTPGVYYEISESASRDVSEFFEDGLDKDHLFEMTYRIKEFPHSNFSYYLITLTSGAESFLSLTVNGKNKMLKLQSGINNNGEFIRSYTEFWADQIFNNDWHTIKYILNDGIFTLYIDDEIMEDFLGFKHIDLRYKGYDKQFMWFDTSLTILQPGSGFYKEPVLDIRHMKYFGNAITTNNTEISLESEEPEVSGYFNSLFRVISRTSVAL
ncbi:uncharacterized protein LOC129609144 [Condylostylus longicornis]|uniref:uncharacterized protein LOC129609144 n=1 Tax=Condylostylus longicornis TaxID=2530218 RepID=UPI00244DCAD1|nr:uncharacterized protein LOC129609144 [Condylostylus longicornis]